MEMQIEVTSGRDRWRVTLDAGRVSVGKAAENFIALTGDSAVSQLHACLEQFSAGWCITDLGSSNGTWLNGKRIWTIQRLRHGDEIRIGQSRLVVRGAEGVAHGVTDTQAGPPSITSRERDVLMALCRPLLDQDMFTEPASTRAIAEELTVTQAAVKQHLSNLFDKFGISAEDSNRRVRLANEALRRGAVSIPDLQQGQPPNP